VGAVATFHAGRTRPAARFLEPIVTADISTPAYVAFRSRKPGYLLVRITR